jgi:hypothetical protein
MEHTFKLTQSFNLSPPPPCSSFILQGTFYEGVLTAGLSTSEADDAVQANIVAAGYGK